MRAHIINKEENERKKRLAEETKKQEQYRLKLEFDEDKNTLTYDFQGNRMLVTQPKEETLPWLSQPKLNVPGKKRRESHHLNTTNVDMTDSTKINNRNNSLKEDLLNSSGYNGLQKSLENNNVESEKIMGDDIIKSLILESALET